MERFLVESTHELHECVPILQEVAAAGYLYNFDWGCKAGVHTAWAIIEAENEQQAALAVPPLIRRHARIVKLNKFSPEDVNALHP
jgi:hypothetical protein